MFRSHALAASTGMRRGEILAIRWRCVDTGRGVERIEEAWKGGEEIGRPKSGRARVAPLTARMAAALDQVRGEPEAFVFGGKTMHLGTWWQKNFTKALKAAAIVTAGRNLTAHSFRHTLNTLFRDAGLDPAKIRAALGWSGERIQDNYTHWQAEHLREIAEEAGKAGL